MGTAEHTSALETDDWHKNMHANIVLINNFLGNKKGKNIYIHCIYKGVNYAVQDDQYTCNNDHYKMITGIHLSIIY